MMALGRAAFWVSLIRACGSIGFCAKDWIFLAFQPQAELFSQGREEVWCIVDSVLIWQAACTISRRIAKRECVLPVEARSILNLTTSQPAETWGQGGPS